MSEIAAYGWAAYSGLVLVILAVSVVMYRRDRGHTLRNGRRRLFKARGSRNAGSTFHRADLLAYHVMEAGQKSGDGPNFRRS